MGVAGDEIGSHAIKPHLRRGGRWTPLGVGEMSEPDLINFVITREMEPPNEHV